MDLAPQLVIYTEIITPRIAYIFEFIFCDFSGIEYKIITDFSQFQQLDSPKINFSNHFLDQVINYQVDDILLQNDIHSSIKYTDLHPIGKCFYWLSRYEEYIANPEQFDQHQRYLGSNLDYSKPIVDIICLDIQSQIKAKYPEIQFKKRTFKQINTHDVDFAWKYLHHSSWKTIGSLAKKLIQFNLKDFVEQIQVITKQKQDPYQTYEYLKNLAKAHQIESIFFWLLGDTSTYDRNLSWKNKAQAKLINEINSWAVIGIHPSYLSNTKEEQLGIEIERLSKILAQPITCSRQHFIKLNFPHTYQQLLKNGITEDYTMGFAHNIGFRAGTCTPFKWFDLSSNQQTMLISYPFVAMDVTLKNYLFLTPQDAILSLKKLKQTIKEVNGTFITLIHPSNFCGEWKEWRIFYESLFDD